MADYGRRDDDQTRDREGSRYGRDTGQGRGQDRDPDRGGGMFGSSRGQRDDDWTSGRREERGWGGEPGAGSQERSDERSWGGGGSSDSARARGEQSGWSDESREPSRRSGEHRGWGGGSRSHHHEKHDRDRNHHSQGGHDQHRSWGGGGRSGSDEHRREHNDQFGYDDRHEGLPIDETSRLIASNKVEGTAVYARDGGRLGSIYNFMVDKRSGKVEYAVMTYGGFLGMGTRYYPMPWDILSYDTRMGGYRVDMMERDLERAPSFDRDSEPSFDTSYGRRVRGWYGLGA